MKSLRRDLLERRLWLVVALFVVAIVAVPFVMHKTASADVTSLPPAPPAVTAGVTDRTSSTARYHALEVSIPRDPFASGMPKLSAKPEAKAQASSAASSTVSTTAATTAPASPAMVSPSPAASNSGSGSDSTSSSSGSSSAGSTATVTTTTTVTTPTTTTSNQWAISAADPSWTIYSLALRFGTSSDAPLRSDLARLTPLPSVAQPAVMFMGVMAGGRQAVFAFGAGVQHAGPGVCRPDRKHCAAIVLQAGQTEQIIVPTANGGHQQLLLGLVSISSRVTHSRAQALAAYDRHSDAGLCELDLADPVTFSQSDGTLSAVATAACRKQPTAVPFPGTVTVP
jgi:hypothetical protein